MKKNNALEIIFYCLFCVLTIVLSIHHEPWFDEIQAWAISKDSISNILFFLPHYEGHPPLWHLILKCFSYFNVPVEYGIKIPNLLFMFGAVWLLIFKAPFPRVLRLVLPFTYFVFYQYVVLSRPYSIFCFAIFLAAYFYKSRDEHPYKFMCALALLCLSSAYGMIFTAGICIAWFIDILKEGQIKKIFLDKRFYSMFILFIVCLLLVLELSPAKNVFAFSNFANNIPKDYTIRFLSAFFILPAEASITNFFDYITIEIFDVDFKNLLSFYSNPEINTFVFNFWGCCLIGLFINWLLFLFFRKMEYLISFFIPYFMFLFFVFILYVQIHHIGLLFLYVIFSFWCIFSSKKIDLSVNYKKILKVSLGIILLTQLYWSICSAYSDIRYSYSPARELTNFIKENNLTEHKILGVWSTYYALLNKETNKRHISHVSVSDRAQYYTDEEVLKDYVIKSFSFLNHQHSSVVLNSYFNKNIFYNFNIQNPEREYLYHITMTPEQSNYEKELIKKVGLPDVIVGQASLDLIFDEYNVLSKNYRVMDTFRSSFIWKDKMTDSELPIYMRSDLYYNWIKKKYEKSN